MEGTGAEFLVAAELAAPLTAAEIREHLVGSIVTEAVIESSASRVALDYWDPEAPVLAVRLQEVFGWTETPRIAGGRVPVTLHLLSPAFRPVQVTRDLAGFWRSTYFEVRKELRRRYPPHHWPDDPLQAERPARSQGAAREPSLRAGC